MNFERLKQLLNRDLDLSELSLTSTRKHQKKNKYECSTTESEVKNIYEILHKNQIILEYHEHVPIKSTNQGLEYIPEISKQDI